MQASLLVKSNCILAESPMWHSRRKAIIWVDIEGKNLYEYNLSKKKVNTWKFDLRVSLVIQSEGSIVLLAMQGGLAKFDIETSQLQWMVDIEKLDPNIRCNDGACDAKGRVWIGTMHIDCKEGKGSLYCVDTNLALQKKLENLSMPNGIVWSADHTIMYHIDSLSHCIQSYYFDLEKATMKFKKTVVTIPHGLGMPDGMTIDKEGMLWVAHWGGFCVCQWNPNDGGLLYKIEVPAPNVSSCIFGGDEMDQLFITTASSDMNSDALKQYPLSGSIFVASPGTKGTKPYKPKFRL